MKLHRTMRAAKPPVFDPALKAYVQSPSELVTVELEIDEARLLQMLGTKAFRSKGKKSKLFGGIITCKLV